MARLVVRRSAQRGVALLVALLILIMISVLGLTAMRTSLFQSKLALGTQTSTMAFQAAESAIAGVYDNALSSSSNSVVNYAIARHDAGVTEIQYMCLTSADLSVRSKCSSSDRMDTRGLIQAQSQTVLKGELPLTNSTQISQSGSGQGAQTKYDFIVIGKGDMPSFGISDYHVLEFTMPGLKPDGSIGG